MNSKYLTSIGAKMRLLSLDDRRRRRRRRLFSGRKGKRCRVRSDVYKMQARRGHDSGSAWKKVSSTRHVAGISISVENLFLLLTNRSFVMLLRLIMLFIFQNSSTCFDLCLGFVLGISDYLLWHGHIHCNTRALGEWAIIWYESKPLGSIGRRINWLRLNLVSRYQNRAESR